MRLKGSAPKQVPDDPGTGVDQGLRLDFAHQRVHAAADVGQKPEARGRTSGQCQAIGAVWHRQHHGVRDHHGRRRIFWAVLEQQCLAEAGVCMQDFYDALVAIPRMQRQVDHPLQHDEEARRLGAPQHDELACREGHDARTAKHILECRVIERTEQRVRPYRTAEVAAHRHDTSSAGSSPYARAPAERCHGSMRGAVL